MILGNELSVGDDVVFLNYNGTSASLERGKLQEYQSIQQKSAANVERNTRLSRLIL